MLEKDKSTKISVLVQIYIVNEQKNVLPLILLLFNNFLNHSYCLKVGIITLYLILYCI